MRTMRLISIFLGVLAITPACDAAAGVPSTASNCDTTTEATNPMLRPLIEENSLFQAVVLQHPRTSSTTHQASNATRVLLQSVTDVATSLTHSSSGTVTPEVVATLAAASAAVSSMLPALDTEHQVAQEEVNRQFDEIEECSGHAAHGLLAISERDDELQTASTASHQCHQELVTAQEEQRRACNAWDSHVNTLDVAKPSWGHTSSEQFYENFQVWKDWILAEDAGVDSHRAECNTATTLASAKHEECANLASNYETAFCQHRLACGLLNACQAHETQVYEDMLDGIRLAMVSRQEQFQTVHQLECLLDLTTSAIQSSSTIPSDALDACDGGADVSQLTITFQTIPDIDECPAPEDGDPLCPGLTLAGDEAPHVAEDTQSFMVSDFNYNGDCPAGYSHILDETQCRLAAADMGARFGSVGEWPGDPRGCETQGELETFYLNTHATGAAGLGYASVCRLTLAGDEAPHVAEDTQSFMVSDFNYNGDCPAGYRHILDETQCRLAAADMGATFGSVGEWPGDPRGCETQGGLETFYLNTHATGAASALPSPLGYASVCIAS